MFEKPSKSKQIAVTPIFQGHIFACPADRFEITIDDWQEIFNQDDSELRNEVQCSVRDIESGEERLLGEAKVRVFFPRYLAEHSRRLAEEASRAIRVDSLSPSLWPRELIESQGRPEQRSALRETLRSKGCIGAVIRQPNFLAGPIVLDESSPFLDALMGLIDYRRKTRLSNALCIELQFPQNQLFALEIDFEELSDLKPGLLEQILAY